MGSVFKREWKGGISWYISYYVNGKHVREKVGRQKDGVTERMAREALKSREGDISQGKFNLAQTKKYPVFDKAIEEYLAYSETHKRSYGRDITSSKHLKPFFGSKRLNEINSWHVEKYKMKRKDEIKAKHPTKDEKDVSYTSINRELALLRHLYTMNIRWGKADHNPVKGTKLFKERTIERYLEEHEIAALMEVSQGYLRVVLAIALNTGMRLREILFLRVTDIDLKNSIINIERSKSGDKGKVPINEYLEKVLRDYLERHTSEYLFPNDKGDGPIQDIRGSFKAALKKVGIKNFRFHDLRHTWASHMVMSGVDLYTLQRLGRWKTLSMVTKYAHLSQQHGKTAINAINHLFQNKHAVSTNSKR